MNDEDFFNAHIAEFLYKQVIYRKTTANSVMKLYSDMPSAPSRGGGGGGCGSSVSRACDYWSGGPGFDPRCGRPLPTG